MRRVTKATELKRFRELEGKYHYMGETHSGGDTMRLVFEEVWSVDAPAQIGLCGGRTLVRTRRQFEHVSGPKKDLRSKRGVATRT